MKRVLLVATSHERMGSSGKTAGVWAATLAHPYHELTARGLEAHLATTRVGRPPVDPASDPLAPEAADPADLVTTGFLHNPVHRARLDAPLMLSEVDAASYDAVLFAGGLGAVFDFPTNTHVMRVVGEAWEAGRVIAVAAHGAAALLNVRRSDGRNLVFGETVTAPSTAEERLGGARGLLPFHLQEELSSRGARFVEAEPGLSHVVVSGGGRLVFAQNNASSAALGRRLAAIVAGSETRTQKIVAFDRPVAGASRQRIAALMADEVRAVRALWKAGIVRESYQRTDRAGTVMVLECADADEARGYLSALPLARARLVQWECLPVGPFAPLDRPATPLREAPDVTSELL